MARNQLNFRIAKIVEPADEREYLLDLIRNDPAVEYRTVDGKLYKVILDLELDSWRD